MKECMRIYIAGKVTDLPLLETHQKFKDAEDMIRKSGHVPVNPMKVSDAVPTLDWRAYMGIAYAVLHDPSVDAIYMLEDWETSKGAKMEWGWAQEQGMEMLYQDTEHYRKYEGMQFNG